MSRKAQTTANDVPGKPFTKVIKVSGELDDSNLLEFKETVKKIIEGSDARVFIFNFSGLEFMGSSIVGYFLALQAKLAENKKQVFFTDCNQTIRDIITFVGLNRLISCCLNVDEAIKKAVPSDDRAKDKSKDNQ